MNVRISTNAVWTAAAIKVPSGEIFIWPALATPGPLPPTPCAWTSPTETTGEGFTPLAST